MPRLKPLYSLTAVFLFGFFSVAVVTAEEAADDSAALVPSGSVSIHQPWIKAGGEEALMLRGYMVLKSDANTPWALDRVTARGFRMVMIHRAVLQDGASRMALQDSIPVPPGETVALDDKGYHLMFMGPRKEFKDGDKIRVVLYFRDQQPVKTVFPVLKRAPRASK
jgi:copper(I)-binding protein